MNFTTTKTWCWWCGR